MQHSTLPILPIDMQYTKNGNKSKHLIGYVYNKPTFFDKIKYFLIP